MTTLTIELPEHVTQGQMISLLDTIGCELRLAEDGRNYKAVARGQGRVCLTHRNLMRLARAYREAWGHPGGFVVIHNGEAVGWKRHLDRPEAHEPGCLALDEDGNAWVATGGNAYDGATAWTPNGQNVVRMPARVRAVRQRGPQGPRDGRGVGLGDRGRTCAGRRRHKGRAGRCNRAAARQPGDPTDSGDPADHVRG